MSDPAHGTYRSREEVQAERDNDPINSLAERMEEAGLLTDEQYKELDREVIDEVERAAEFAESSPVPDRDEIYAHVYADEFRGGLQRRDAWR
jgi:pyruvate dehydrogenase E1 component alpha subunit